MQFTYDNGKLSFDIHADTCEKFGAAQFSMIYMDDIPGDDWNAFFTNDYGLGFDCCGLGGIPAFQLEIKDPQKNKLIDKLIPLPFMTDTHDTFPLRRLARDAAVWKHVSELRFTVFMHSNYMSCNFGTATISGFKRAPAAKDREKNEPAKAGSAEIRIKRQPS